MFGIWTLIPPLVIIVFALWTKRTFEALLLGTAVAFVMVFKVGGFMTLINELQATFADEAWMLMVMFLLGAFAFLLSASKGSYAIGVLIEKISNTEKKTLMMSWILGILIFMDDYLNILTISSTSLDLCDKQKTPREMLAYVIDSTGAPVCVLLPISSWAIYFASCMEDAMGDAATMTGFEYYVHAIPFTFYGWTAVFVVPLVILGVIPKMFGMKKAYDRVANGGKTYSEKSAYLNTDSSQEIELDDALAAEMGKASMEEVKDRFGLRLLAFFVPIGVVITVTIITSDLLIALFATLAAMFLLYIPTKLVTFNEFCDKFCDGCASMVGMNLIMLSALTVSKSMKAIELPDFVIDAVLPFMGAATLPAIAFLAVACLSFITGSNWGIPAITFPILIPLALAVGANPVITLGAIVSGGTFGSHACFYSDATVLTSKCTKMDNMEHALTQFPYACIAAGLAFIGFLISGFLF